MEITKDVLIIGIPLIILTILFIILYIKKIIAFNKIYNKYKGIIDIDSEIEKSNTTLKNLASEIEKVRKDNDIETQELRKDYQDKRSIYEKLLKEISILEEDMEFISYGLYKPHYNFDTSEKYKEKLNEIRKKQKELIKEKTAIVCHTEWTVGGSKREGRKMTNQSMKLMLRAFNNECDAAVLKVKWNNIQKMEERIEKAYEAINKLGSSSNIDITSNYLNLKLEELRLAHELEEKIYEEKEEQRRIKEEMREEEKARREFEQAQKKAEEEEKRYESALLKAREEVSKAEGAKLEKLNKKLAELEMQLNEAKANKERAISQAQMTKSGHVYVISNIGSFGENVYKIGMTRRLEPLDRVKELGDASVPFSFDVHAMIYSENAPELENKLHNEFNLKRLNRINNRKEFFKVSLDDITSIVQKDNSEIEFTKIAEAKEYRETLAMIEEEQNKKSIDEKIEEDFPSSI
jgi:DNA repair exonuclease SbcCD ATPase subunit